MLKPYTLEELIATYNIDKEIALEDLSLTDMEIAVTDWLHARTEVIPTEYVLTYLVKDF